SGTRPLLNRMKNLLCVILRVSVLSVFEIGHHGDTENTEEAQMNPAALSGLRCNCLPNHLSARFADNTRMIASPDGPTLSVPTTTGSPSRMLMSVVKPVFS